MEPETTHQEVEQTKEVSPLHQVTPISKYLAMVLFIILPFVGGWIGYTYAPEKVVEVERTVEVEKTVVTKEDTKSLDTEVKYLNIQTGLPEHSSFAFDLNADKTEWILYENKVYGFSFEHSPNATVEELTQEDSNSPGRDDKIDDVKVFSLREDDLYRHWIPTIRVTKNTDGIGILEQLEKTVYQYTSDVYTTVIDGRPAFWLCTGEMGGCAGYVVTENFIFRLHTVSNITFSDSVVGSSESDVEWPERIAIPVN